MHRENRFRTGRPESVADADGVAAQWNEQNNSYVARGLAWVRALLALESSRSDRADASEANALDRLREEVVRAETALRDAEQMHPPPALLSLAKRFGLSEFEQSALLLCAGVELDSCVAAQCQALQQHGRSWPCFALMLQVLPSSAWEALSPERPLRYYRLLDGPSGSGSVTAEPLRLDEPILHFIKGLAARDERLFPFLEKEPVADAALSAPERSVIDAISTAIVQRRHSELPVIALQGHDATAGRRIARAVCERLDLALDSLQPRALVASAGELDGLCRLIQRQCLLLGSALLLDSDAANGVERAIGSSTLAKVRGLAFVLSREPVELGGRVVLPFAVEKPTRREQQAHWTQVLGDCAPEAPLELSTQFDLSADSIEHIAAECRVTGFQHDVRERLWAACRAAARWRAGGAPATPPGARWSDLVLSECNLSLLQQLADQVKNRGRVCREWGFGRAREAGISALFAGPSGTGKTLAARVLASELGLDLIQHDLSTIVSKFIGQTAKNLRRVFDAAESGGCILFFDEADALFGRRTDIFQSQDRYANMETDYLLQRLEAHGAVVILATNSLAAIDGAFLRRMRFCLRFEPPGPVERRQIWQQAFPRETPLAELDWELLSRFELTGAGIHNVAVNAAFAAARDGSAVAMPHVLFAARLELAKHQTHARETPARAPSATLARISW